LIDLSTWIFGTPNPVELPHVRYVGAWAWDFNKDYIDLAFKVPKDMLIHAIMLRWKAGTLAGGSSPVWISTAGDKAVKGVQLIANGSKYIKNLSWTEYQVVAQLNGETQIAGTTSAGYNKLYFTDPNIPQAKPLPAWLFTSLELRMATDIIANLTTGSPTSQTGTVVDVSLLESKYNGEDLKAFKVLMEKRSSRESYLTATGEKKLEHERVYEISDYIYEADDNATLSNTIFDRLTFIGKTPMGEEIFVDDLRVLDIRAMNQAYAFNSALPTGFFTTRGIIKAPFPANQFTSLYTKVNIPTAGTDAGLRIIERYVL
jgi:hypothetical protein